MTLTYDDVLKMKKAVDEVFHLNVHFHDACGGQYFSLDDVPSKDLKCFITDYFKKQNINVYFTSNDQIFTLD